MTSPRPLQRLLGGLVLASLTVACGDCGTSIGDAVPIFQVTPSTLDFAVICVEDSRELTASLRNVGTGELVILESQLSGEGYSLAEPLPGSIAPDDEVVIRVRLTAAVSGQTNGALKITTDDPENPVRTLTFVGEGFDGERLDVKAACELGPDTGFQDGCRALNFSDEAGKGVPAGTTRDRTVRLRNEGCAPAIVNTVYFAADDEDQSGGTDVQYFSVVSEPAPFELPGGGTRDVVVRFSPPPGAAIAPFVRLKIETNVPPPKQGSWDYGLFADSVAPQLLVEPDLLTFFDAQTDVPRTKAFTIQNTGSDTLRIDGVELVVENGTTEFALDLPGADTGFDLPPAGTTTGRAVYTSSGAGSDRAKIVVRAGTEVGEVRLLAGTEPQLVVRWLDPATADERVPPVDFGETTEIPGDCRIPQVTRTLRLRNDGDAPLTLTGLALSAADNPGGSFAIVGANPATIAPHTFADVTLAFDDAVRLEDDSARLRITSDDPVDLVSNGVRTVDLVSRNVANFPPNAIVEHTRGPAVRRALSLLGQRSFSEPGDVLTYAWTIAQKESGSTITLETPDAVETRVVSSQGAFPDTPGFYRFQLRVTDQCGQTSIPGELPIQIQ